MAEPNGKASCRCLECKLKRLRHAFGDNIAATVVVHGKGAIVCKAKLLDIEDVAEDSGEELHHVPMARQRTVFKPPGVG